MKPKNKNVSQGNNVKEGTTSFFEKMKTDKQYNAKVQLIGFGIFIAILVIYVNISSLGSSGTTNSVLGDLNSNYQSDDKNTVEDSINLLEKLENNYRYDITVDIQKNGGNGQEIVDVNKIRYVGKSFKNQIEITREDVVGSTLYYKVDNRYYSKNNEVMDLVEEDDVYSVIDSEYIELDGILEFIDKASLDHVTDYSSGKKEYVYHLKVKDIIVSYKLEDVIEIEIEEENGILKLEIDYTNLFRVVDETIIDCELEAIITDIGKVEEFLMLDGEENTFTE